MSCLLRTSGLAKAVLIVAVSLAMLPTDTASANIDTPTTPLIVEATEHNLIAYEAAAANGEVEFEMIQAARPKVVAAKAPRQVRRGKAFRIRGTAQVYAGRHAKPRRVRLVRKNPKAKRQRTGKKWSRVAVKKTKRNGRFAFKIRKKQTRTIGQRVFRVRMPRAQGLPRGTTGNIKVRVVAPPAAAPAPAPKNSTPTPPPPPPSPAPPAAGESAPLGSARDWSWLYPDGGRWNGCSVITWGYHPDGGYPGALEDVKKAFTRISNRTGLTFRYAGQVTERPRPQMPAVDGVNIVVGWSNASLIPQLAGSTVGLASAVATTAPRQADVKWKLIRGWVALDTDGVLRKGFANDGIPTWGQVMTHEIGHVVGLGHASARTQLMASVVSSANHRLGAGDIAGLHRVGAAQPCLR